MTTNVPATVHKGGLLAMLNNAPDSVLEDLGSELGVKSGSYLKFSGKSGFYTFNGKVVEHGSVVAFNFFETTKGFVCYADDSVRHRFEEKVLGGKALPTPDDLEALDNGPFGEGEGWKPNMAFQVRFLDTGEQATLSFASGGGVRAAQALFKDWYLKAKMELDDNGEPKVPLVELHADEKKLKKGSGSYWVPKIKIVEWVPAAELAADLESAEPAPKPAPKPAARAGRGFGTGVRGART